MAEQRAIENSPAIKAFQEALKQRLMESFTNQPTLLLGAFQKAMADDNKVKQSYGGLPKDIAQAATLYTSEEHKKILIPWTKQPDNLNKSDEHGNTVLHLSAKNGRLGLVKYFIKQGANINLYTDQTLTPLLLAVKSAGENTHHPVMRKKIIDTIEFLLTSGAKTQVTDNFGASQSAIFIAVCGNDLELIKLLHEKYKVDINEESLTTPLHMATLKKDSDQKVIEYLQAKGGIIKQPGKPGV